MYYYLIHWGLSYTTTCCIGLFIYYYPTHEPFSSTTMMHGPFNILLPDAQGAFNILLPHAHGPFIYYDLIHRGHSYTTSFKYQCILFIKIFIQILVYHLVYSYDKRVKKLCAHRAWIGSEKMLMRHLYHISV